MKKKYLCLYFIDTVITLSILVIFLGFIFVKNSSSIYSFNTLFSKYYLTDILAAIGIACFIVIINLLKKKYTLDVNSLVLPICYLVFTIIVIVAALVLNRYVVAKNIQFVYYYRFIIINYILLNIYTITSFKK